MRIVEIIYRKPANLLIAALQQHCMLLLSQPEQHGINNLEDLKEKTAEFAAKQAGIFPRCKLDDIEVISDANILHQFYNLLYKREKPMITIFARPDDTEQAFRDYDGVSQGEPAKIPLT